MTERQCQCLLCVGPVGDNYWNDRDRRVAATVTEHGWNVMGVFGDERTSGWAYSIGLWHTLGSPEIAIFGLDLDPMMEIVNIVGGRARDGLALAEGQRQSGVVKGFDILLRPVSHSWYRDFFGAAIDFYQRPPLPMLQVIWPDKAGLFPGEPGADQELADLQPMLWLSKQEHPAGIWTEPDSQDR
jgi:hypothetical protein